MWTEMLKHYQPCHAQLEVKAGNCKPKQGVSSEYHCCNVPAIASKWLTLHCIIMLRPPPYFHTCCFEISPSLTLMRSPPLSMTRRVLLISNPGISKYIFFFFEVDILQTQVDQIVS